MDMRKARCGNCFWKEDCADIQRCKEYDYDCWKFRHQSDKYDTVLSEYDKNGSNLHMHGGGKIWDMVHVVHVSGVRLVRTVRVKRSTVMIVGSTEVIKTLLKEIKHENDLYWITEENLKIAGFIK